VTEKALKVGLTPEQQCSYLTQQRERLMVLLDPSRLSPTGYEELLKAGFRRSGDDLYRPHCQACQACCSLRIPVEEFNPDRRQRRILRRNQDLSFTLSHQDKPEYYDLFCRYISLRHRDGTMYPPSRKQYDGFLLCSWLSPLFMEFHSGHRLIAVAITDAMPNSLSAMYTLFEPEEESRSLGTYAILSQIALARRMRKQWLYLGYQIEACRKMNYKTQYLPHEQLIEQEWKKKTCVAE